MLQFFNFLAALYDTLDSLTNAIVNCLSGPAKKFYEREFDFFSQITDISGKIRPFPKGKIKKDLIHLIIIFLYV